MDVFSPMKKIFLRLIFFFISLLLLIDSSVAQCAMCRATIENNPSRGENLASGLNAGILYLASVPYLAIAVIGYLWYRNSKKMQQKLLTSEELLRRKKLI